MSRPSILFLVSVLLLAGCGGEEGTSTSTKVGLATRTFEALKADDFASFTVLLPSAADTEWMFERMTAGAPEDRIARMTESLEKGGGYEGVSATAAERARAAFDKARASAAEAFEWSEATFGGLVEEKSGSVDADGVEIADINFYVDAEERREVFGVVRCANVDGRWITAGGLRFRPSPHSSMDEAKAQMTKMRLRLLGDMAKMYEMNQGKKPESIDVLRKGDEGDSAMRDAWDHPLHLELVDGAVHLSSPGPDGTLGTEDDVVWPAPKAE